MMQLHDNAMVWEYFHTELGLPASDDFRGVCLVSEMPGGMPPQMSDVAAAVAYNGFVGRTCCMHMIIKRPELMCRRLVRQSFEYPFIKCGCEAVLALVDAKNQAALDIDTRLGFTEVARIPNGGHEGDLVVLHMQRSECRWLRAH